MSVRTRLVIVVALVAVVFGVGSPVFAAPEALTKTEITCQTSASKALAAFGKARTACVAKCQKKTPLSTECSDPFGGKTLECVQKADDKLDALFGKKCRSEGSDEDSCPECYEQRFGTCVGFEDEVTLDARELSDDITSTIFCDDTGSPDGLTKAEAKCQKTLVNALTAFVGSTNKCATACLKNERKGKTNGSCNPEAFVSDSNTDEKTGGCVVKAGLKLFLALAKCDPSNGGETPECLESELNALINRVQDGLVEIGIAVDVCPTECGDGFTQGLEECDPNDASNNCGGQCTAQCTCPT